MPVAHGRGWRTSREQNRRGRRHTVRRGAPSKSPAPGPAAPDRSDCRHPPTVAPGEEPRAADLELNFDDPTEFDEASSSVQVQGDHYHEAMQKMVDR